MNISLTTELENYISEKVSSGLYTSASEVICEPLKLMHNYDDLKKKQLKQLNQSIESGLNQLASGEKDLAINVYQRLADKISKIGQK